MTRWATFDCYGTLVDWETGIANTLRRLWPDANVGALVERYHDAEPLVQKGSAASYRTVLADALRAVADGAGLPLDEPNALSDDLPNWPPFPETAGCLAELRGRGWRLAILSNTDPDLLDASIRRIGADVDERITVREAGSYKPAPGHWMRFADLSGASTADTVHIGASQYHDMVPGAALGYRTVFIDRHGERLVSSPTRVLRNLSGLPRAIADLE